MRRVSRASWDCRKTSPLHERARLARLIAKLFDATSESPLSADFQLAYVRCDLRASTDDKLTDCDGQAEPSSSCTARIHEQHAIAFFSQWFVGMACDNHACVRRCRVIAQCLDVMNDKDANT